MHYVGGYVAWIADAGGEVMADARYACDDDCNLHAAQQPGHLHAYWAMHCTCEFFLGKSSLQVWMRRLGEIHQKHA